MLKLICSGIAGAILFSSTFAAGSATGTCGVKGTVVKVLDNKINKVLLKVSESKTLVGNGLCQQLKTEALTVTVEGNLRRIRKGQKLNLKTTCYHNMTPEYGIHDCHKWVLNSQN